MAWIILFAENAEWCVCGAVDGKKSHRMTKERMSANSFQSVCDPMKKRNSFPMGFFGFHWFWSRFQPFFNNVPCFFLDFEPFSAVCQFFFSFVFIGFLGPYLNEFLWFLLDSGIIFWISITPIRLAWDFSYEILHNKKTNIVNSF